MTGRLSNRNAYSYRTTDYQDKPARSSRIQYDTDNRGSPRRQICYNRRTRQSYRVLSRKGTESLSRPHRTLVTMAIRRLHPTRFNRLLILQGMKHGLYAFHSLYFLFIRSIDSPPIPIFSSGNSLMETIKNCDGIWVISEAVAVSRSISNFFCSEVNAPLSMVM